MLAAGDGDKLDGFHVNLKTKVEIEHHTSQYGNATWSVSPPGKGPGGSLLVSLALIDHGICVY